jgi:iron complex transport system permease protein
LGIVWRIGVRRGAVDPLALVLAGVIVGSIFSAGSAALQSLVPAGLRGDFVLWMMGRVPEAPPQRLLLVVSALAVTGAGLGIALGRSLDAACLSDDEARSVGVPLGWLRVTLFLAAGILTAATVSLTGPIAFVGLVAPHAARLLVGPRHATLALGSALAGAALLLAADSARQLLEIGGGRLPVGVLTAVIGGPVFLLLLRRAPILRQQGAT